MKSTDTRFSGFKKAIQKLVANTLWLNNCNGPGIIKDIELSEVTTTYLEMNSQNEFIEKLEAKDLEVVEAEIKDFKFNRQLYSLVGGSWSWTDKLVFTDQQQKEYAESENLRTWAAYHKGSIAGYFELNTDSGFNVEIAYFGLAPQFIGKGFGGYLLSSAIKFACQKCNASRIWVHTCTSDHPNALSNYQARGLKIYREEKPVYSRD